MKKNILILILLAMYSAAYAGDFSKVGTAAAQFLKIGVGARANALGGSFTAIANDVSTIYWNPAGITNLNRFSLAATHNEWFADISHDFAGVVYPVSSSDVLALHVIALNTGEQEVTTVTQPEGTGVYYDVSDLAIGLSYARVLTDRFSVGMTVKYIQQNLYNESASTFALDLGTYLRTGFHDLIIAMNMSNFGGNMQLEGRDLITITDINNQVSGNYNPDATLKTEPWPLPLTFRVGIAMDVVGGNDPVIESAQNRLTIALDGVHPNDNTEKLNIGGEYAWDEMVFARVGYKINYDLEEWTFGVGLRMDVVNQQVGFDYALVDFNDLGKVSQFSLELRF
ncbi:MAG TPA: PorV/PorQ family protein [Ignavibacteriaceae bacterium]